MNASNHYCQKFVHHYLQHIIFEALFFNIIITISPKHNNACLRGSKDREKRGESIFLEACFEDETQGSSEKEDEILELTASGAKGSQNTFFSKMLHLQKRLHIASRLYWTLSTDSNDKLHDQSLCTSVSSPAKWGKHQHHSIYLMEVLLKLCLIKLSKIYIYFS